MPFRLNLSVRNPGPSAVSAVIHGGTVFEVEDPFSGVQNLAAVGTTSIIVPPGETQVVVIDTWCVNHHYAPPQNTAMRLTSLALAVSYAAQNDVWGALDGRPRW